MFALLARLLDFSAQPRELSASVISGEQVSDRSAAVLCFWALGSVPLTLNKKIRNVTGDL